MKIGTLQELNLKPGDVVECVTAKTKAFTPGCRYKVFEKRGLVKVHDDDGYPVHSSTSEFQLVTGQPLTWAEMTPEEKGALLLARHEGKVIEYWQEPVGWLDVTTVCSWSDQYAYRVRPEPVREVVTMAGYIDRGYFHVRSGVNDTHRITFDLINGKPDCSSIKMEKL
jgi:hypothetical protein